MLIDNPTPAVISLMRELYTNALVSRENDKVFVKGKRISFSSKTINAHYGLPRINENEDLYDAFKEDEGTYKIIIEELCVLGT